MLPLVKRMLQEQALKPPPGRRQDVIHPSEMAKADWCHRATYNRIAGRLPGAGDFSFTLQNIFAEGNFIHEKWQRWLADTGQLWGDWHCEICQTTMRRITQEMASKSLPCLLGRMHKWHYREVALDNSDLNIHGFEDGALVNARCLVEFKSVGLGTLRFEAPDLLAKHYNHHTKQYDLDGLWRSITRPFPSHVRQVNVYMWLAREMGLPFDTTAVVYEYKVNQQVKEFIVSISEDILKPMLDRAREIKHAFQIGTPPACSFGGCKYCQPDEEIRPPEAGAGAPVQEPRGRSYRRDHSAAGDVRRGGRRLYRGHGDEPGERPHRNGPDIPPVETDEEGTAG